MPLSYVDTQLCGQWENFTTPVYTFFQNAWGQDSSGGSCLNITQNATSFASTWKWTNSTPISSTLVHAFPNINYNPIQFIPTDLSAISSLDVNMNWNMHPSVLTTSSSFEAVALAKAETVANVAFDIFLDPTPSKANQTGKGAFEVMFWLGTIGEIYPIGGEKGSASQSKLTCNVGNTMFSLYNGTNANNQHVFTWLASTNTTQFSGDLAPCIKFLVDKSFMPAGSFLGVVQFGTETLHADEYITFTASNVKIDVKRYGDAKTSGAVTGRRSWGNRKGVWAVVGLVVGAVLLG